MMKQSYLEQMRAHIDEGGQLNHRNGVDLLVEVEKLREILKHVHNVAFEHLCPETLEKIETAVDMKFVL